MHTQTHIQAHTQAHTHKHTHRNSKRSYEQKIAFNIKHDSKSFYAYVRSKQKVQDKVSPVEGSDGNIIIEGFLIAERLDMLMAFSA